MRFFNLMEEMDSYFKRIPTDLKIEKDVIFFGGKECKCFVLAYNLNQSSGGDRSELLVDMGDDEFCLLIIIYTYKYVGSLIVFVRCIFSLC